MTRRVLVLAIAAVALVAAACSEGEESGDGPDDSGSDGAAGGSIVEEFAGEEWFLGTVPDEPEAADPDADPIVLGMINQEETPLGSFPELRRGVEGSIEWVNEELGGVGGRPLELVTCVTSFDVEQSQACAQEMVQSDVVALVGGIDVTSNGSLPVIEANDLTQVGGIPANLVDQQSDATYFFSGGVTGGLVGFLSHAAENDAEKVVIAYGEFDGFQVPAENYGLPVAESLGMEAELVTFPITATDFLPILTRAAESDPDAMVVAVAGSSCIPVMETFRDLEIDAQLYLVGACAADEIIEAANGSQEGVIFNSEGPVEDGNTEGDIYNAINERYADEEAAGAGTVGVRGFMNLYGLLTELGPDGITPEAIRDLVSDTEDKTSFWGYPYTCKGELIEGLPSLCAPQQTLFEIGEEPGDLVRVGPPFIDTAALIADAL